MRRKEGRPSESSFQDFRNFIDDMNMGEINFRGEPFTWANNRKGKVLSKRYWIDALDQLSE